MTPSLLSSCQRGDARAWRQLYENFATSVYRWSLAFGLDRSTAEETTQEVFITATKRIGACTCDAMLAAWLFQTTRRHAANARRLGWLKRVAGWADPEAEERSASASDASPLPELSIEVRRALRALPMHLAEVLVLHDLDGRTRDEIAAMLSIAPGTVASRLRLARQAFEREWM